MEKCYFILQQIYSGICVTNIIWITRVFRRYYKYFFLDAL